MYLIKELERLCIEYGRHQFTNPILARKTKEEIEAVKEAIAKFYFK